MHVISSTLRRLATLVFATIVLATPLTALTGCEQSMVSRSQESAAVLRDFSISSTPIPEDLLSGAKAVAVIRASEGGVVVTGASGKGVMVHRTGDSWSAPIALDLGGGSFGAQIGGKAYDVVMVFRNEAEVEKVIKNGGYSIADASATAGPDQGQAKSDDNPVRTFVRTDGLFVGARVGGVKFTVNDEVNHETYGVSWSVEDILAGKVKRPLGTSNLYKNLPPVK
ncbi:MAG: lipid-binding SYLF domain-containing protein [Phycisphaerae bacterium]|nr:lipid-binding SYLF domain-containing protein [Phycisphaerae bacterium]